MTTSCRRIWEVEAYEDGRLDAAARASFERHLPVCAACTQECAALARLGSMLVQAHAGDSSDVTSLEKRRLRAAILRKANERSVSRWRSPGLLATVLCCVLASTIWIIARRHPQIVSKHLEQALHLEQRYRRAPTFEVDAAAGAKWQIERQGPETSLSLADGRLEIHVGKLSLAQRFVLRLPDGEIEVRGTRFFAHVQGGKTIAVGVTEGAVALRLMEVPERVLLAGDAWRAQEGEPRAAASASLSTPPPLRRMAKATPSKSATESTAAEVSQEVPSAGVLFDRAMAAFSAGSYETADELFRAFEQQFSHDARVEDAAFLRIVIRQRLGDKERALQLGRLYLARYPGGLRREDVERLVLNSKL